MPRPRKIIRPVELSITLPSDIVARLDLELFSPAEGRVPIGKRPELIERLLRRYFAELDAGRVQP